ncbi:MAG: HAD family phosphatase [Bryobacteraceae bacterium]
MISTRYEAVLFDFDGVLVDSEPLHFECWNEILRPFDLAIGWDDYVSNCIGVADRAMIQAMCRVVGRDDLFPAIWERYPSKKALFRDRMVEAVPMPAATRDMLAGLGGFRLAVVSSSGRAEIEPTLEAVGVRNLFETIVTGEDVSKLKPSPEPYQTAAQRLGVTRALVVEDSAAGIASGRAAGFDVVEIPAADLTAELVRRHLGLA